MLQCFENLQAKLNGPTFESRMNSLFSTKMSCLPAFKGTSCHDHWKPYYQYDYTNALCNAHHLRELTFAWEQDGQQWAKKMKALLEAINKDVIAHCWPSCSQAKVSSLK